MKILSQAHVVSTAPPSAFFARWADMTTWPEWNADTEWVRLDGPFAQGSTGQLKPKGGPKIPFVIEGPLAWPWTKILGRGIVESLEADLAALATFAEADVRAGSQA